MRGLIVPSAEPPWSIQNRIKGVVHDNTGGRASGSREGQKTRRRERMMAQDGK